MTFSQDAPGTRWTSLRDELAPFIGERAVALFAYALTGSAHFGEPLAADGEDPDAPQVTEAEQLLIDWGRVTRDGEPVAEALSARLDATFSTETRRLLDGFARQTLAT